MSVGVRIEETIEIPPGIDSLEKFREWALSDDFPEIGRIDYIQGVIDVNGVVVDAGMVEVELMPERMISHSDVKAAVARRLTERVLDSDLGKVCIDGMRFSSMESSMSCEPDVFVLLHETIESGEVGLTPASGGAADFIEIQGGPDLVVEIVSPSSVAKDTRRLPSAYFKAGVREFWPIDARDDKELRFQIFRRGESGFVETEIDDEGFQNSGVLDRRYRLTRERGRREEWRFVLEERGLSSSTLIGET